MPTKKKRINLTVTEDLYKKIVAYRNEHCILSDAAACVQLIFLQLKE